jgi:hypothetical protein
MPPKLKIKIQNLKIQQFQNQMTQIKIKKMMTQLQTYSIAIIKEDVGCGVEIMLKSLTIKTLSIKLLMENGVSQLLKTHVRLVMTVKIKPNVPITVQQDGDNDQIYFI